MQWEGKGEGGRAKTSGFDSCLMDEPLERLRKAQKRRFVDSLAHPTLDHLEVLSNVLTIDSHTTKTTPECRYRSVGHGEDAIVQYIPYRYEGPI